jgi:hypothetical protein
MEYISFDDGICKEITETGAQSKSKNLTQTEKNLLKN